MVRWGKMKWGHRLADSIKVSLTVRFSEDRIFYLVSYCLNILNSNFSEWEHYYFSLYFAGLLVSSPLKKPFQWSLQLGGAMDLRKQLKTVLLPLSSIQMLFSQLTALDATLAGGRMFGLVEGLSTCEALQCDTTVGYGGSPDENGETCLDSMVFDAYVQLFSDFQQWFNNLSEGMKVGAVANLHRIRDAARVAWGVMNFTKHTLLVGESATQFAKSIGFKEQEMTTNETKAWIDTWKSQKCQPNFWKVTF